MIRGGAALILFVLCVQAYAVEIIQKEWPEIKGAQLFVLDSAYGNNYDLFFEELQERGVNTLFIRVFHNASDRPHGGVPNKCPDGGVYFQSRTACVVDDILPAMIEAGHRHDIALYAWMATRSLTFLKKPQLMSLVFMPDGTTQPGYGANIFNPYVRSTLLQLYNEIAATGVDGILVQDDFIIKYNEGADSAACLKFTSDTGMACTAESFLTATTQADGTRRFGRHTPQGEVWGRWKAAQLQELLSEIRSSVRLLNPEIKWAVNIYYETPVFPHQGLAWYAQDLEGIWETGVDYIAVMAYQEQIMKELGQSRAQFLDFASELARNVTDSAPQSQRGILKIQSRLFDANRTVVNGNELRLLCTRLERGGASSFVQLPIGRPSDIQKACGF